MSKPRWRCIHRHTKEEHPECYARVHNVQFKESKKKKGYQRRLVYEGNKFHDFGVEYLEKMTEGPKDAI